MDIEPSQTIYCNNLNEKIKKAQLKKALYSVFSQFGKIVEIVACRGLKLRGQAWVCFDSVEAATNAMAKMQGFPFYDKPTRIAFSKSKSDVVAKRDGSFVAREKRKRDETEQPKLKAPPPPTPMDTEATTTTAADVNMTPSSIIFAQNLPDDCNEMMLEMLFKTYAGFKEVRMVPGSAGLAFIEFTDELTAGTALAGRQNFKLTPTQNLALSYAKK
eukprot:FR739181.1.p1 GENE.FR739181.1~~FR739181.1.p1  ORF type:complete len:216 (+),score=44.59 FR739181.1:113-760(+)